MFNYLSEVLSNSSLQWIAYHEIESKNNFFLLSLSKYKMTELSKRI